MEPGIRVGPRPDLDWISLRAIAPTVTPTAGGWRMYLERPGDAPDGDWRSPRTS
ncbi:MAG: hypothetical protein U0869_04730 [Chloroflexota bacterium]